jgi:glyoxylase-like metal-dependent hydrolase (beta-lactamase superfamily II)
MKVADGVEMLKIQANAMGRQSTIFPTLIWDTETAVLVDAGYPGLQDQFRAAIEQAGVPFNRVDRVIITHHDIDHIGGLPGLLKELPQGVAVLAHKDEKAYIEGQKRPLKLAQMEDNLDSLPGERKAFYVKFKSAFENSRVPVNQTLADSEVLPYCGGIEIIFTPGHTLGHISLYHRSSRTLISGDALRIEDGILVQTPAHINYDTQLYKNSLKKMAGYDIRSVICYHGGLYQGDVTERITELAEE